MDKAVIYCSNKLLFILYKYTPIVMSAMMLYVFGYDLYKTDFNGDFQGEALMLVMSGVFIGVFFLLKRKITEVEISYSVVKIENLNKEFRWEDVISVHFSWAGLYVIKVEEGTFYFPSYDLPIKFLGNKLNDEFDELINAKKNELGI